MTTYKYTAVNAEGKTVRGEQSAEGRDELYRWFQSENLVCTSFSEKKTAINLAALTRKTLPDKELSMFCRKLTVTFGAGMSIVSGLNSIISSTENDQYRKIYTALYELVRSGRTLSSALSEYSKYFPPLLINMVAAGEESGNFEKITEKLALYFERQQKIRSKIKSATVYPKLLGVLCLIVVIVLFAFVLPEIFNVFSDDILPPISRFMLGISNFMVKYWYAVLIAVVCLILFLKYLFTLPSFKLWKDTLFCKLPVISPLLKKIYSDRFASTLTMLYSSGLSMITGIRLSTNVIGNKYIENHMEAVSDKVSAGNTLASSIAGTNLFDPMLPSMIEIGEESGSLDSMLNSISAYYEEETSSAIDRLLAILEPALLIFMAIIIGTILISVMVPIFNTYSVVA